MYNPHETLLYELIVANRENSQSIEKRAENFILFGTVACKMKKDPQQTMYQLNQFLGPPKIGQEVLAIVHKIVPKEKHVVTNGNHDNAIIFNNPDFPQRKGPLFIVTLLPPNSNPNLAKLNIHDHDIPEFNSTPYEGIESVFKWSMPLDMIQTASQLIENEARYGLNSLIPTVTYRVPDGQSHSVRNTGSAKAYYFGLRLYK